MSPATPDHELQAAVNAYAKHGSKSAAAASLGMPVTTLKARLTQAELRGIVAGKDVSATTANAEIKRLRAELAAAQERVISDTIVKRKIVGLANEVANTPTPTWATTPAKHSSPGVPTLFMSDFHWGEVVRPEQIGGVNEFNLRIARARLHTLAETTVKLLGILSPKLEYPGIVLALGGDMLSGNIHEELVASNEKNVMPCVLDLFGELGSFISTMADTFGKVFLPCVTGNHGRDTHKMWSKDRHHTSFDWLLYCFLAKHFEKDKRITFLIPDGPDAYYRVYGHRYLLTHGDQFRGGDGMIGALGPIIRGDHKKRSRNAQVDMDYDTMLLGHWHQYIHLTRLIVNGTLKGYDEYANQGNFGYEPPQQALWITHPRYRITYRMPVFVSEAAQAAKTTWVAVPS